MCWSKKLESLCSENLSFSINELPSQAYLVGGAVRDALLQRQKDYTDLDFVVPEGAIEAARTLANHYQAGFVILDAKRHIARVVFEQGTVDFAQQEGETLEIDLRRRDFTVNAIAYHPQTQALIDPLGGLIDLQQKTLRMISLANLQDDPLRLLRAYRQAAQLNFTIESTTRATIRSLASLLGQVAAERVQSELNYLLTNPYGSYWLKVAWQDGVLKSWLKNITEEKLQQVSQVDEAAIALQNHIQQDFKFSLNHLQIAKLASLVSSIPEEAEAELMNLKYSRVEIRTVIMLIKNLMILKNKSQLSLREQYFLFLDISKNFFVFAIFALVSGINETIIKSLLERYLNSADPVAHPQPLIKGNDLIEQLHLPPSPLIGKLLTEIQIAQIEGKIKTASGAIIFARDLLKEQ